MHQQIEKLKKGSYEAFSSLYKAYAPKLYSYVYNLTDSQSLAKDIVQETFIKIWIKRDQIDETLSFQSFLFTIARNQVLNEFRRQLNNPVFSEFIRLKLTEESIESSIENRMDFDVFNQKLQLSKKKMTNRQIQIFELNKEKDFSVKEIASLLNIKEQVVRNQLSTALSILRKEMKDFSF